MEIIENTSTVIFDECDYNSDSSDGEPKKKQVKRGRPKLPRPALKVNSELKHTCTVCDKTFTQPRFLTRHILRVHSEKTIPCPHCPRMYAIQGNGMKIVRISLINEFDPLFIIHN